MRLEFKFFEHVGNPAVRRAALNNAPLFLAKGLYAYLPAVLGPEVPLFMSNAMTCASPRTAV